MLKKAKKTFIFLCVMAMLLSGSILAPSGEVHQLSIEGNTTLDLPFEH